jgi:uncharacterized protein (TIRG00374 family)
MAAGSPSKKRTIITAILGLIIMVAVFAFLFPNFGTYEKAFAQIAELPSYWIWILVAVGLFNIIAYPLTAMAAIPGLPYRAAFVDRQAGFLVSNIIPGGGAVAVGTQYSILAKYGVPPAKSAAAVSADAIWTYLMVLGTPALAVVLLVIEGRSTAGYTTAAVVGIIVVAASILGIWLVLRSKSSAEGLARRLQPIANRLWHLFKRPAPDLMSILGNYNMEASALVRERWLPLTLTNALAQMTPWIVLIAALAALGVFPSPITPIEAFAAFSIALLLTSFPITPGGLGTVDAALVLLLTGFGIENSTAVAADLMWRLVWFLPQLLVGLGAFGLYYFDSKRSKGSALPPVPG